MRGTTKPSKLRYEPENEKLVQRTRKEAQLRERDTSSHNSQEAAMDEADLNNGPQRNHRAAAATRQTLGEYAFLNANGCVTSIV